MTFMLNKLSAGKQQRIAVAQALANDPALLLADKPTAALASVRGRQEMELFRQVAQEHNTSVPCVTCDQRTIDVFVRMWEMEDGIIKE